MLTMPILMIFYSQHDLTAHQSFLLKSCYSLSIVVFEIPSGIAADLWGRKRTLVTGSILGTVGFVIYSLFSSFYAFMAAEFTLGLGMSFISGADSAMIYDTLQAHGRQSEYAKYEGRNFSVGNFAEAAAGFVGGALAALNLLYPFYAQTLIAFTAVPAALTLVEPPRVTCTSGKHRNMLATLRFALIDNSALRWNILYSSVLGCVTLSMAWVYPLRLSELGFDELHIGTIHTVLNLLLGVVTLFAYRIEQKLRPKNTVRLSTVTLTIAFVLAGLADKTGFLVVMLMFYLCRGIATPVLKDYVNRMTSSDIRATVLSLRSLIIRACFVVVAPLFGYAADIWSLQKAFVILGIVFIAVTAAGISLFLSALEKMPTYDEK